MLDTAVPGGLLLGPILVLSRARFVYANEVGCQMRSLINGSPARPQAAPVSLSSDRRAFARASSDSSLPSGTVTLLCSDIEGSTRLLEHLEDDFAELLDQHRRIMRAAILDHEGCEINTAGDGFFVAFSGAANALRAVVDAQCRHASTVWPDGLAVRVRMGLHTGRPLVSGEDYIGIDVHRAARICAKAHGGQVIVSDATKRALVGDPVAGVRMRDLGEHALRGLSQRVRLHQIVVDRLQTGSGALYQVDGPSHRQAETRRHSLTML